MKQLFPTAFFLLFCVFSLAAQSPWDGSKQEPQLTDNVYEIKSSEELAWIASESLTRDFSGYVVRLTADLDLGGKNQQAWIPIGSADLPFAGEADGNGHIIRNLYILGSYTSAGLFAATSSTAKIHHIGLSQGLVLTDGTNDVGALVGINEGEVHHCFNMVQVKGHNGQRIGGLVGSNKGQMRYCYNTGIVDDGNDIVGGLAGLNEGEVRNCYNTGYTKGANHTGSLFGKNKAGSVLEKVYFDQQMTRMHATGDGEGDNTLNTTDHAVTRTSSMLPLYQGMNDPEWDCTLESDYPQLACFAGKDASVISTYSIHLDAYDLPQERADGVGAPKNGTEPRKQFGLCHIDGISEKWVSENTNVISLKYAPLFGEVFRPCTTQEVILTVSLGEDTHSIYTQVKGYDSFDPGIMYGDDAVCWNEIVKLKSLNKSPGKEASGGKDDEQKGNTAYQYKIYRYEIQTDEYGNDVLDENGEPIKVLLDSVMGNEEWYDKYNVPTDVKGHYVFVRKVHDSQCHTEYAQSAGEIHLHVRAEFDPGELYEKPDTIYGVPVDTTVLSKRDATGGDAEYEYLWTLTQLRVNYVTGEVDTIKIDETIRENRQEVRTPTYRAHLTEAGEYLYDRRAKEKTCNTDWQDSQFKHRIVVYDSLRAGAIDTLQYDLCSPVFTDTICEKEPATGGNGRYTYRWLCNDVPIDDTDSTCFTPADYPMQEGNTYVFTREVTDDTGLAGWVKTAGSLIISIQQAYDAGAVVSQKQSLCLEPSSEISFGINIAEKQPASGDGTFAYCWLLMKIENGEEIVVDTIRENTQTLTYTFEQSRFPALQLPDTVILMRAVQNEYCRSEWRRSEGSVTYYVGLEEKDTVVVSVCVLDMPYAATYTYQDGHEQTFQMSADGQSYAIQDTTPMGCRKDVTLICATQKVPIVEVLPVAAVCQTDSFVYLQYDVTEGRPDHYRLEFDKTALAEGFQPIDTLLPAGNTIPIPLPTTSLGDYKLSIQFYNATEGGNSCMGYIQEVGFSLALAGYVHRKWNDVLFVDNSDKNCEPDCEGDLTFTAYQWYKDGEAVEGAEGQYYYETGGLNGVYHVMLTATDGTIYRSCDYEMRPTTDLEDLPQAAAALTLSLYPVPALHGMPIAVKTPAAGNIMIYSIDGQEILTESILSAGTHTLQAPRNNGIYLLRYQNPAGESINRKLIVK